MTISEKVAYLKGLAEGLNLDTEKSKEGKLISVMIGILEEVGLSIEDLEENALALGEEIDVLSDDLADVESEVFGEDEEDDDEEDDFFEVECPNCEEPLVIDDEALAAGEHDAAHRFGAQMLLHLHHKALAVQLDGQRLADARQLAVREAHVHHAARYLNDLTCAHAAPPSSCGSSCCARRRRPP